jgi:hypothetical protein
VTTLEAYLAAGRSREAAAVAALVQAMAAASVRSADELDRAALILLIGSSDDVRLAEEF